MPRVKGTVNIRPWRAEQLIRDLAVGDKTAGELAEIHDIAEQSVWDFKMRHKADIAAVLKDWSNKFDHIWSTKLENRLRVLTQRLEEIEDQIELLREHAQRETETIRSVDPSASEVPVNGPEYRAYEKEQRALIREIADQTGQLPTRVGKIEMVAKNPITDYDVIVEDADGSLHAVQQQR